MPERERRLLAKAMARVMRRQAAVDWMWDYFRTKWNRQPHVAGRITVANGRHVPALWRSPRRYMHIFYEDCLHLLWDAQLLVTRLMASHKDGKPCDKGKAPRQDKGQTPSI